MLATAVRAQGKQLVVVTGQSLAVRDAALGTLARLLAIGGAAALLLASACGYGVTAAALRLVESMRRQAAQVTERDLSSRMPVNPSGDELSRLGQTLNGMLERLDRAFNRERTFVDDASHELRSPLAILKAELEVASREGRTLEEVKGAVRSAIDETDRLAQLADDLLLVARSDQGRLPMHRSYVRVSDIFAALAQRFALRSRQRNRVIHEAPTELALVGDRRRIEQALGSLIDNSLRHGAGDIRLEAGPRDGAIELHVTDEGDGFEAPFLDHAFERFSRADDSRSEDGAGLGLSIVKAIAEAHGGRAAAANLPSGGADVWISIPLEPRQTPDPTANSPASAAPAR
jgi:signal transduction histidine kinase